jgi:hypothetical protein
MHDISRSNTTTRLFGPLKPTLWACQDLNLGPHPYQRWTAGRLCYPASLQLALIHEWYILAACGRVMTAIVQRRCSRDKSRYLSAEQIRWRPRS